MKYTLLKSLYLRPGYLFVAFLLIGFTAAAQNSVSGTVTDGETNTPLPGVNVIAGTSGVITDFDGNYELNVPNGITVLTFSSLGFASQ